MNEFRAPLRVSRFAQYAAMMCGMACVWLCLKVPALMLVRRFGAASLPVSIQASTWYAAFACAFLVVCFAISRKQERLRFVTPMRLCSLCAALFGSAGLAIARYSDGSGMVMLVCLLLQAVGIAYYLTFWGLRVVRLPISHIPVVVAGSYALSEAVRALGTCTGSLDSVRFLFPLFACVCTLLCASPFGERCATEAKSLKSVSWKTVGTGSVLVMLWTIAQGALPGAGGVLLGSQHLFWSYALSCAVLTAIALYFHFRFEGESPRHAFSGRSFLYPFAFIIFGYMAVLAVAMMAPSDSDEIVRRTLISVSQCLEVFALMLLAHCVAERQLSPVMPFGVYATLLTSSPWMLVADILHASGILDAMPSNSNVLILLSFVTAIVFILFLLSFAAPSTAQSSEDRDGERECDAIAMLCEKAARGAKLSPRELEVMKLLYRGYSGKRIAQDLYISDSTVHSHTSSIYRKLGIHSKQQLITLVDAYRA
jgi:DNA-binding NarL/FixJ family response regulator